MQIGLILPSTNTEYDVQLKNVKEYLSDSTLVFDNIDFAESAFIEGLIEVVVASNLTVDVCDRLRNLGIVVIIFGDGGVYDGKTDIIVDYKKSNANNSFTSPVVSNNQVHEIAEITELIKVRDWDTDFFGFKIAYIACFCLSPNIYDAVLRHVVENNIQLIEFVCDCNDLQSIRIAEKMSFKLVDIRMTYSKKFDNKKLNEYTNDIDFRKATEKDLYEIEQMAGTIFTKSRYIFDDRFPAHKVKDLFKLWAKKAILGKFDDESWCLSDGDKIIAFCTIRYMENNCAQIGLIGVDTEFTGKGIGKRMLENVLYMLTIAGIKELKLDTQGRNYAAQNLYSSAGFKLIKMCYFYHKWY